MQSSRLLLLLPLLAGCSGTAPSRSLPAILEERDLTERAPIVLVDLDDTIYEKALGSAMAGAPEALRELARDHLIVYLTARTTHAKVPGLTHNRRDSRAFLERDGFPAGPLFTSSVWNWLVRGQGGGKMESFRQLREFGVERVALAVGDRPHDLEAYTENGHVAVERTVIILIEDGENPDRDRGDLPRGVLSRPVPGTGAAWPRILSAYRSGKLTKGSWVASQPTGAFSAGTSVRPPSREPNTEH